MWFEFALAVAVVFLCLFVPGFLFFKAIRTSTIFSFACAPLYSIVGFCSLGVIFPYFGVKASAASIVLPCFGIALIAYIVSSAIGRTSTQQFSCVGCKKEIVNRHFDVLALVVYVIIGLCVTTYVYVSSLDGPNSFVPTYDNVFHYSLVRSYVDSGDWSVLNASAYPFGDVDAQEWAPLPGGGYYPAAWHVLCALAIDIISVPVPLAANSVNALVSGVIYPSGMCLLMTSVFPGRRKVVLSGALFTSSFWAFPFLLLNIWPLFPNTLSLSLFGQFASCFIIALGFKIDRNARVAGIVGFVMSIASSVFSQPTTVFAVAVFLIPFCVWRSVVFAGRVCAGSPHVSKIKVAAGVFVAMLCGLIWLICHKLPFLQSLVGYYWAPIKSISEAAFGVASLSLVGDYPQLLLALLVAVGLFSTLFKREDLWVTFSFLVSCLIFVASAALGDNWIKHLLSGFWYTDPYRVGAFTSIFAVPLASLGFCCLVDVASRLVFNKVRRKQRRISVVAGSLIAALFCVFNFSFTVIPGMSSSGLSAFGAVYQNGAYLNSAEKSWVYDSEEIEFVEKVIDVIPEDSLVVNQPFDGSLLAYGINHLNTYYRAIGGYNSDGETSDSVLIRTSIDEVADNADVRDAVQMIGAEYLMILDHSEGDLSGTYAGAYDDSKWVGINSVDDLTEGFEVVLSDGEMRLYKIIA